MTAFKTVTPSKLDRAAFIETFADIYEHSPWVAERAFDQADSAELDDVQRLHRRLGSVLAAASHAEQLALINAHPDLAGKAAVRGELTESSTQEQAGAGIHLCTAEEFARFTELNHAYKAKFQFPFIMAVRGSDRHQILAAFEQRIHNDPETEFREALAQIDRIALLRLQQL
ncbi:2-oxo-4-hydroxy-4-carboxy-5-ureidoimidazoline decarboxylase [Pseudomonas sp. S75]|uniref:2-oxo-4-hydroxy-4-carboxy-5-ureidoimidazoline decarboxylase n=1 Tax=unclassified Pseudomonas TaxID=196821 RepID=UPI001905D27B|nr:MULTISPECIES: 2-oxo-4-hydroxy-4-carboxy-5-ureidoimidazoline decarboxylase [unclassified Pseudomonas]MBJ9977773.1 2-oxo-4-hydroxy-4-carboxy-5-ureidoimidazoline decarboxylase [Pseudomonas sp. S30]MBK0155340.1 2-oxo-4-hydroxy-4-carboxy-5-ureidoimidazoline decarboxylase [Pseudomonas sp. S75]